MAENCVQLNQDKREKLLPKLLGLKHTQCVKNLGINGFGPSNWSNMLLQYKPLRTPRSSFTAVLFDCKFWFSLLKNTPFNFSHILVTLNLLVLFWAYN